ncbi:MAG: 16S rRNA (cytosine(1402)-N(4))-methyltransferase RsmH [Bacteroidetes bacterium]|nr:16S rRNA (cytosine(1402)-N(4))-methyltransferase RsmH [Bacteroidota bacterium]
MSWANRKKATVATMYHRPVLLNESIELLGISPGGVYVDATFGGGGHSREILNKLENGRLIAFDQDEDASRNAFEDPRFTFVGHNFRFLKNFLRLHKQVPVDGILADLGISSHQIDVPARGFSTRAEGSLDMRMDRRKPITAQTIINLHQEGKLVEIFRVYGEIPNSKKLASRIIAARKEKEITSTSELVAIAKTCAERGKENKYLAQVFQALRIEVNQEMEVLEDFLKQCLDVLKSNGRLAVISYHSLEDKMVKNYFRTGNFEGELKKDFYGNVLSPWKMVTRKAVVAGEQEIEENSRARSARLRVAEKV